MKRLLRGLQVLEAADRPLQRRSALFEGPMLLALDGEAEAGADQNTRIELAEEPWLLAPVLVDPHSHLEDPDSGTAETLGSLATECAAAGYGTVALLPRARSWRDLPESLHLAWPAPLCLKLWGALSRGGQGQSLAPHGELLGAGAVGLSDGELLPPLALLERSLLLGEADQHPLLVAPLDPALTQAGFVREGVAALRLGWPLDPAVSESLPLRSLLALGELAPQLRLLNLSTAAGVALLAAAPARPLASVCWWHLSTDNASLDPLGEGWRVRPSLGGPSDRLALSQALRQGLITAVAVHHSPLDREEQLLPLDQRRPGVAGYQALLPCLWQALVEQQGWAVAELWQALSWGPSRFLGLEPERLLAGSRRWLLWDPSRPFVAQPGSLAANCPLPAASLRGQVLATGLQAPRLWRWDPG